MWIWKSSFGDEEANAVHTIVKSGKLSVFRGGTAVREFEEKFAQFSGAKYGVATTSGTTALHSAVTALGITEGDEVLVPPLTFVSTASVVLQEKAIPVFVDVEPTSYCMSPQDLESKITKRTKAIIPVHIYGHPADMYKICDIARRYNLAVISDSAQAHGAKIKNQPIGAFGNISCYSFFQTKNMTTGEGGMAITNDDALARKLRLKREHGSIPNQHTWYAYEELGYNYAMTELQAAVGLVQLKRLEGFNERRRENASFYQAQLSKTGLVLPRINEEFYHVFHNFPILLPEGKSHLRSEFVAAIRAEGVPVDICYPVPLYETNLFRKAGISGRCPNAESITSRIFTLFTDPALETPDLENICAAVIKVSQFYLGG